MADIVFLNLEQNHREFVACVEREKEEIRRSLLKLAPVHRPSFRFVNSVDDTTIHNSIVSASKVLHIAGHGKYSGKIQSTNTKGVATLNRLADFADYIQERNEYLDVGCVIFDSCYSAGFPWRYQLARLLGPEKEMICIGSSLSLPFTQAETFFADFYAALLTRQLPSNLSALHSRIKIAFDTAQKLFVDEHGKYSRMRISTLRH